MVMGTVGYFRVWHLEFEKKKEVKIVLYKQKPIRIGSRREVH